MNKTFLYIAGGIVALVLLYFVFKNQISNTVTKAEGDSYNVADDKSKVTQEYAAKIAASTDSFEKDDLIKERDEKLKELDEIAILRIIYKQEYSATAPSYYTYEQLKTAITNKRNEKLAIAVKEYKKVALKSPSADLNTPEKIYSAIDTINAEKQKQKEDAAETVRLNTLKTDWANRRAELGRLIGNCKSAIYVRGLEGNKLWLGKKSDDGLLQQVEHLSTRDFWYFFEHAYISWANDHNDLIKDLIAIHNNGLLYGKASISARAILERRWNGDWAAVAGINEYGELIQK